METINHECYVSLEVAKLLKEAGFDWEVQSYYSKLSRYQEKLLWLSCGCKYKENINTNQNRYSAPTLEIAQRWLREVRSEYVVVHPIVNKWFYSIHRPNFGHYYRDKKFSTYEEAQEAGIKKVLEFILHKK